MASNFALMGSYATVQITGPSTAVDVLRITGRTIPSGVVFTANAPYKNVDGMKQADVAHVVSTFIEPLAEGIERMMGSGEVSEATASEDINASGLVIDYIDAVVAYGDTFTQVVRVPTQAFDEPSLYDSLIGHKIDAAYRGLQALAGA